MLYQLSYTPHVADLAGKQGIEPRLPESESGVLPLDDFPNGAPSRTLSAALVLWTFSHIEPACR